MARTAFSLFGAFLGLTLSAQTYTSWFTGNTTDLVVEPLGGTCMMGGASEFDPAMQWFLDRANGGDVLVLRASGSDGYNDYMYTDLGGVNSVETILFNSAAATSEVYVLDRISKAEAIWFAGGDQWNYVNYWRNSPIMTAINDALSQRHIAIGGTSAGMAILGSCYFSAQNGSVLSSEALSDPFNTYMTGGLYALPASSLHGQYHYRYALRQSRPARPAFHLPRPYGPTGRQRGLRNCLQRICGGLRGT
jgi:cyanophycinase-like exopeptidase